MSEGFKGFVSRGFRGRRGRAEREEQLPPGQYLVEGPTLRSETASSPTLAEPLNNLFAAMDG